MAKEDGDRENDVPLANIVPKIEVPESDKQEGQAELNREAMEATNHVPANLHNMKESNAFPSSTGTNDNCNTSSDMTTSCPDLSDTFSSKPSTSSTFGSCSTVPIRLPVSRPAHTDTNMSKNLSFTSSPDSTNFVSSCIGISSDNKNQFNTIIPPPTRRPPMLETIESVSGNGLQLPRISSSTLISSEHESSPIKSIPVITKWRSQCNKSSIRTSGVKQKSYIGRLSRDPSIQLTPSNAKNIKITNIIRRGKNFRAKPASNEKPALKEKPVYTTMHQIFGRNRFLNGRRG
ncbi:uncharacterized protein LOC113365898 isoform X2 [Ctenocephalides felis]|uniref:uncharacterized protein LOC113365898 isoform X2 n=1 Tax=Ctenocephalides felis TaxID=7515 RepID=UPI000E6E3C0B|nr:uncharacterized protein LOC113365898 isoform X2 [Ctenocephalides felis]